MAEDNPPPRLDVETQNILLNHVVLPRVLPQEKARFMHQQELVIQLVDTVENVSEWLPTKSVEMMERLKRVTREYTRTVVSEIINELEPGDSFSMFVRRQNTTIMFYIPKTDENSAEEPQNIIVTTFMGTLHPKEIFKHESDLEYKYPMQAYKVKFSTMLQSEEFANQLHVLHEQLPVGTKHRNYVSKWLMTILTDEKSTIPSIDEFPIITKKIRDESLGERKTDFFRRSGFYFSTKVMLHHNLTMEFGAELAELGTFVYKIVMLKFLIQMCAPYKHRDCTELNIDLMSQMIAKMARRIDKLLHKKSKTITPHITDFHENVIREARETIQWIRQKIDAQIELIQCDDEEMARLPALNDLDFEADSRQRMPELNKYLRERAEMSTQSDTNQNGEIRQVRSYRRYFKDRNRPLADSMNSIGKTDRTIFWIEFEKMALYEMSLKDEQYSEEDMRKWLIGYTTFAEEAYAGNQLMASRVILVHLKFIAILDRRACLKYPLLRKHSSGINPNIVNTLLLPQRIDMEEANKLEKYFRGRNECAPDPGLIEEQVITQRSFSVKFVKEDDGEGREMFELRNQLMQLDEKNVNEIKRNWATGRDRVKLLREKANEKECTYIMDRNGEIQHRRCDRCFMRKQAQSIRLEEYEHLLPKREFEQFAVVFELKVPSLIACLRDILYGFVRLGSGFAAEKLKIKGNWIERRQISEFNESTSQFVTLGSTKRRKPEMIHVDEPLRMFVVENSYNLIYHVRNESIPTELADNDAKKMCTFKMQDEYECLQWTVDGTTHTQNQVIARQSECAQNLSLAEYKHFGSMRADGHRLQIRNLYAAIATEALAFEKESVLLLIMQMLWECGISGSGKSIRESHMDFNDVKFCTAMIQLLEKFVQQQQNNWMHPFKMLIATMIAMRAFELNDDEAVANQIATLLRRIRAIVVEWIDKIERLIQNIQNPNESNEHELHLKLMYVAITGCFTFSTHAKHRFFERIMEDDDSSSLITVQYWLHFIITLKTNSDLFVNHEDQIPTILRMLARHIESTGVQLEPTIKAMMDRNLGKAYAIIGKHWSNANRVQCTSIAFDREFQHIFVIRALKIVIEVDIISGSFLINGAPLSQLPVDMTANEAFQWFFGTAALKVQLNADNHYSTIQKHNDRTYEFRKLHGNLIITERQPNGNERELINHRILCGQFPNLLRYGYTHWLNKQDNCIEFQQRTLGAQHFSKDTQIDYRLDLFTNRLIHVKSKRMLLDIKSYSCRAIVEKFSRLEHARFIHVLICDENPNVAIVDLFRMKLKFRLDCTSSRAANGMHGYQLESNEFTGMRVSRNQKLGTLYGLNHGLVLESCTDKLKAKLLLMPYGEITSECTDHHVNVDIELKSIRNPPFFKYEVDEFCQQLKASDGSHASWFYLAYLHAITSHGECEPLTGMSGTERALQILQSSFAWSSRPYEPEAQYMLHNIAKLTPIRKMHQYSQTVAWPSTVPPRSAQDSFIFIVKKLLSDSQRLYGLYSKEQMKEFQIKTDLTLCERDYHRCLQLQPNLCVSDTFIEPKLLQTAAPELNEMTFSQNTQTVSILYHNEKFLVPENLNLRTYLTNREGGILKGETNPSVPHILYHSEYNDELPDLWIGLYNMARNQDDDDDDEYNEEKFALILSLFAHQSQDIAPILALQTVAQNPAAFESIDPPQGVNKFQTSFGAFDPRFDADRVANLLRAHFHKVFDENQNVLNIEDDAIEQVVGDLKEKIVECWPCHSINLMEIWDRDERLASFLLLPEINAEINQWFEIWYNNYLLHEFIDKVETCIKSLSSTRFEYILPQFPPYCSPAAENWPKYRIDVNKRMHQNLSELKDDVADAQRIWQKETQELTRTSSDWRKIIESVFNNQNTQHLVQAGLLERTVPSLLLPKILQKNISVNLKALIGAWAITIVHEQRQKRIDIYSEHPDLQSALDAELENQPHDEWEPCKRPEWLLFEIEQNLTIRRIQIKVAEQMIDPPAVEGENSAKHSVMQLNMGEGKTAVIVPILASVLADGKQACQVTVLKSLFTRNLKFLRQYLGGLLNRRIYLFPCRRDLPMGQYIEQMLDLYKECKWKKGVILTLPEHRLSLQLKIYEPIKKENIEMANNFMELHKWINANVRNILDESDAILQPNYQLIYTVGNQAPPDGGSQRWSVTQAVFKRIPYHMKNLYERHGMKKIEFDEKYLKNGSWHHRSDTFPRCRILDESVFAELKSALIVDFLNGELDVGFIDIVESSKDWLYSVISDKAIDKIAFQMIHTYSPNERNVILILSGLLRFEVLQLALMRRWRVNFGVDPHGQRKMAIPFKAKDVASEMTEFGHPDVAICFTQISYYYSGLSDEQLRQLFVVLENKPDAPAIYEKWIDSIPRRMVDPSIRSYKAINLDDPNQRDAMLFPLLRFNMFVIDFFLSNLVYPYEAKIFEQKLMSTAWDLCSDQLQHCVTGFSGTNDTKDILPLPIVQNDLQELENTNEEVRQILVSIQDPQNHSYEKLPPNVSGMYIVKKLAEQNIPVLLDSGALMLELTNKQVAIEWLKLVPESAFDAAVYFDSNDILQTIDRNGIVTEFDCSVYRDNLSRCVVYLDDVHTRGTDLKFPLNWVACVTLSGDITRDKTVQSCMRMRRLGKNQKICFWASYEADIRMRKVCQLENNDDPITNEHVIEFICHNSRQFEVTNMVHWTMAALNYTKKSIGHKLYENSTEETAMEKLYDICVDDEFTELIQTYGDKEEALLKDIAWSKFNIIQSEYKTNREIRSFVRDMQDLVVDKLAEQAPDVKQFSRALNEEQEKELEQELEEQRFVERPPIVQPAEPAFDKRFEKLILDGVTDNGVIDVMKSQRSLYSIGASLTFTQLFRPYQKKNKNAWSENLLVTKDFVKTVADNKSQSHDDFLRPIWWIARIGRPKSANDLLLLMSPHECHHLLPLFRKSTKSALHMHRPRLSKYHSNLLDIPALQITGSGSPIENAKIGIDVEHEAQIGMYAGSMYFASEAEQNAYCGFMGLIPHPRNKEQDEAFVNGNIKSKGYVPLEYRQYPDAVAQCVGKCKFHDNPVDMAIKLIEAHHQTMLKESHVATILEKGTKQTIKSKLHE